MGAIADYLAQIFAGAELTPRPRAPENPDKKAARQAKYRQKNAAKVAQKAREKRWRDTYLG